MFGCSVHESIACKSSSASSSVRSMFVYDAASLPVVLAVLLLLKPFDSLLQLLHHALQDHGELLIIEGHILSVQVLRLAHGRAQGPAGLHVLGHEADVVLARSDSVENLRRCSSSSGMASFSLRARSLRLTKAVKAHELKAARRRWPPPARALSSATPF